MVSLWKPFMDFSTHYLPVHLLSLHGIHRVQESINYVVHYNFEWKLYSWYLALLSPCGYLGRLRLHPPTPARNSKIAHTCNYTQFANSMFTHHVMTMLSSQASSGGQRQKIITLAHTFTTRDTCSTLSVSAWWQSWQCSHNLHGPFWELCTANES